MKLLYIVPRLGGAGGLQRILLFKAGYLAEKKDYDITILVTNPDTQPILFPVPGSITIKHILPQSGNPLSYFFAYRKAIAKNVSDVQPDAVVVCDNGLKSFFLKNVIPLGMPVVYEMHASKALIEDEIGKNIITRLFQKPILVLFKKRLGEYTKFVAPTENGVAEWGLTNGMVLPNPLWFHNSLDNGLVNKKIVVMGRHAPQKGYDRMFTLWKRVAQIHPDWVLEIFGTDNPDHSLKEMATSLQLKNIVFKEPVKDIEHEYLNAALSIMTSYSEPFGMVLIEAMACGVPCVAYDCPSGPRTIIRDGENGFLIPDGDEDTFVNRLEQLMQDHELRKKMGVAAKETASSYDMETIMERWDKLFRSLIKGA